MAVACFSLRTSGIRLGAHVRGYPGMVVGPTASRHICAVATAKRAQRAASIASGMSSTAMRIGELVVFGVSVLQCGNLLHLVSG